MKLILNIDLANLGNFRYDKINSDISATPCLKKDTQNLSGRGLIDISALTFKV